MSSKCFVIAIAGGSGSGKTTLARHLCRALEPRGCAMLGQDSYYFDQSSKFDRDGGSVNFDHPSALEFSLMADNLKALRAGLGVDLPVYEFATHSRAAKTEKLVHSPFIIVEGTLILSRPELCTLFDESVFIEVAEDVRFQRRLHRDVHERGRTPDGVREQFFNQVKVMHDQFVEPSKSACTVLVRDNREVIARHAKSPMHAELLKLVKQLVELP